MFSLASVFYRNALSSRGGPIASLETFEVARRGVRSFEANACLREDLAPKRYSILFAAVDGSGADLVASVARQKAVSEAIERWALLECLVGGNGKGGIETDPTSNGFAAFPGMFARQARHFAWLEAAERWCLFCWWEGMLRAEPIDAPASGVNGIRLLGPFKCTVVILWTELEGGFHVYGYAAGLNFVSACEHALTELDRHSVALRRSTNADLNNLSQHEARALFFGGNAGFALFQERVEKSRRSVNEFLLHSVFDGEIFGPWSRYAHVWRVLFRPPSSRFLTDGREYFWW
jgi:hypothetical protein